MDVNAAAGVGAGHDARLEVDELERIASTIADDGQSDEGALFDGVANISGAARLYSLGRAYDLHRLGQPANLEREVECERLVDVGCIAY